MEGEVYNFICSWLTILVSLIFCYTIGKIIPQGTTRFLVLIPVFSLFFLLPFNLTTMHLGGLTSFFIAWLANFKLLLFAFGKGPLSNPNAENGLPIPLSQFIPMACLPIKISHGPSPSNLEKMADFDIKNYPSSNFDFQAYPSFQNFVQPSNLGTKGKSFEQISKKGHKTPLNFAAKIMVFFILLLVYGFKENLNLYLKMVFYCFHIYFMMETIFAILATLARTLVQAELEPQFNEPYLTTSLQDFWGKWWNLMVSSILRPTVYYPVRSISTHLMIPKKWATLVAVFVTFLVSGLMHELIFYYIGRNKPTGEVTCFFVIQGVCLDIEIVVKKSLDGRFKLHPIVSGSLTLGFVMGSSFWWFFPPFLRFNPDVKGCKETVAFLEFIRHGKFISPYDISCPFNLRKGL